MPNITTNHAITYTNQMVTSEIREEFHARFVLGFGQNASEIIA